MKAKTQNGFTLVEVLIAMFIFSLISVGATSALTSSLRGKAQMNERLDAMTQIQSMRSIIRGDLSQIILRESRDAYGSVEPYVLSGGVEDLITFTRSGRMNPGGLEPRSEFQRVSYVFESGNLIRRSLDQTNPAPQTISRDRILLAGLDDADISFQIKTQQQVTTNRGTITLLDYSPPQDTLLIAPNQTADLPSMITIDLTFLSGDELRQHFEITL